MLKGKAVKSGGKSFTMSEGKPGKIRKQFGHTKDVQAAKNFDTGGDDAMNVMPSFEEVARTEAAKD